MAQYAVGPSKQPTRIHIGQRRLLTYGRLASSWLGHVRCGTFKVERGYSDAVRAELAEMGHTVEIPQTAIGGSQAIQIHDSGILEGASDPRKDGCALGY